MRKYLESIIHASPRERIEVVWTQMNTQKTHGQVDIEIELGERGKRQDGGGKGGEEELHSLIRFVGNINFPLLPHRAKTA